MNPSELRMMLMSHYNAERISLEDAATYFGQTPIGLSIVDELTHHSGAMNMNPMMSIVGGEYGSHQAAALAAAAAAAAAAQNATGTTLAQAPSHALLTTNPELYGITNVGNFQHLLQQAGGPFTNYSAIPDDDEMMDTGVIGQNNAGIVNGSVDDINDKINSSLDHSENQNYDHLGDDNESIMIIPDNREVINIDDFISMDNDENDDDNEDNDNSNSFDDIILTQQPTSIKQMSQITTQQSTGGSRKTRKIEPVNRPGLVLKTPIAYKGNIDPSVIPIQRDGMAVCERCGAIGVKHTFYTKSRRYCSMACARSTFFNLINNTNDTSNQVNANNSTNILMTSSSTPNSVYENNNFNTQQLSTNNLTGGGIIHSSLNSSGGCGLLQSATINANTKDLINDLELNLQASQIKNSNYRFKIANDNDEELLNQQQQQLLISQNMEQQQQQFNGINNENGRTIEMMASKPMIYRDIIPQDDIPQLPKSDRLPSPCPQDDKICSIRRKRTDALHTFDWLNELCKPNFFAAPVTCFPHAPGYDMWDNIGIDMKVEVENTDCDNILSVQPGQTPHSFWVATVLNICGYKALMRYEGFDDDSHDFWVNLCSSEVHPVGWCATRGKPLIPPKSIENKYSDWKEFLVQRLSGARTLPSNFYNKIADSFKSRFRCGLNLECVDKNRISQVKLATVHKIVGKRLYVKYYDAPDDGFWCHEDAPIIHPVGWATTVGHSLAAPQDYLDRMIAGQEQMIEMHEDDAPIELFKMNFTFEEYYLDGKTNSFVKGMKLEAVDPLNLSSICVATVMVVLKFGYMMIRIDSYDPDETGADWFCYHEKSPSIFPVGFCAANNIQLTPPHSYDSKSFSWDTYLKDTKSLPAQEHLFDRTVPEHGFQVGMKLECADLMDPRLVCVATVSRIVGRLIKVSFDGWPEEYDQWLDCESPDFYPVGWCVLVDHKLEGPPTHNKTPIVQKSTPKSGKKKKKKVNTGRGRPPNIKREGNESRSASRTSQNSSASSNRLSIKLEMKNEPHEDEMDDYEYDDEEEEIQSGKSRSEQSTPLICSSTPEPPLHNQHEKLTKQSNTSSNLNINSNVQKSTSPAPPVERKATSYISNTSVTSSKYIPRLINIQNELNNSNKTSSTNESSITAATTQLAQNGSTSNELLPHTWNIHDVSQFLRVNDLAAYCDAFSRNKVDGKSLLELSKDEIVSMLCMKVGPAVKIYDLIQQLKTRISPNRSKLLKLMKANNNRRFS